MADRIKSRGIPAGRGVEYTGIPDAIVPGAQSIPGTGRGLANQGRGVNTVDTFAAPSATIDIGDAASEGTSPNELRADCQFAFPAPAAGYPQDVAAVEADGSATTPARSDHVHKMGIVTTKGDVLGYSTVPVRIPVGTDGQVLTSRSSNASGVDWEASAGDKIILITDSMTDTAGVLLPAHTAETGQTYIKVGGVGFTGDLVISNANRVRPSTISVLSRCYSTERQCYDWECTADIYCADNQNDEVRLVARFDPSDLTRGFYAGTKYSSNRQWVLSSNSGSQFTTQLLASDFTANTTRTIRFVCAGYRMELWINGVLTLWYDNDPGITITPGQFAIIMGNGNGVGDSKGLQLTNLSVHGDAAAQSFFPMQFPGDIPTLKPVTGAFGSGGYLPTILGVGADGSSLVADSSQATGLRWAGPSTLATHLQDGWYFNHIGAAFSGNMTRAVSASLYEPGGIGPMGVSGHVLGISVEVDQARTGGTLTVEVLKNGASTGLTAVIDGTNTTFKFTSGSVSFAAADFLDVLVTTSGFGPLLTNVRSSLLIGA